MGYRLAAFDFDGTLADSWPWFAGVLDQVSDEFGIRRIGPEEGQALRGCGSSEIVRRLGVPTWELPRIARRVRSLKAASAHEIPLFEGVGELLRQLSWGGVLVAIVSSDAEANVRRTLGPGNAALVDRYGCGASLFGKHAKLRRVLKECGVPAAEAIYVGDEVRDAEAARAVGAAFGAVPWGFATPEALRAQAPSEFFASVDEIGRKLARGKPRGLHPG